ncbi:hypothetical protein V6N13_122587 [Hibiscus sabdariffa]|uniref:Uncharacterized protein n=1 Tax=Hibiscus sabdariffa TaxID=183260 RepID=A0ABR2AVV1_9ROSI
MLDTRSLRNSNDTVVPNLCDERGKAQTSEFLEFTKLLDMRVFDSQEELTTGVSEEDIGFESQNEEWIRGYNVMKCMVERRPVAYGPEQQSGPNEMMC